jgi:hypothetical protein
VSFFVGELFQVRNFGGEKFCNTWVLARNYNRVPFAAILCVFVNTDAKVLTFYKVVVFVVCGACLLFVHA